MTNTPSSNERSHMRSKTRTPQVVPVTYFFHQMGEKDKRLLAPRPPTNEDEDSKPVLHHKGSLAVSRERGPTRQSDDKKPPKTATEANDAGNADGCQPKSKERVSRKAKEDALKSRNWVEVRKRKAQAKSTPVQEVKHSHANESADVGTEDPDEEGPNGTEYGPVAVESDDDSTSGIDEDIEEREPAVMKLVKRKRVNSEVSQQGFGDDGNHQAAWMTVPTRRERPVSLGSLADRSPSSLSTKRTHKRQKIQPEQKTSPSRRFQGSDPSEPSNSDVVEVKSVPKPPRASTKRANRTFQAAVHQKQVSVDYNYDDVMTSGASKEKQTAVGRKKPRLAISNPFFKQIWKRASKELKRSVFFINPFPDSDAYETLPLDVYAIAIREVSERECYDKDEALSQARQVYNNEWTLGLTTKLSILRGSLKSTAILQVHAHFKDIPRDRQKKLLEDDEYWFKLSANGEAIPNAPFMTPVLQSILREGPLKGRVGLYRLFPEEFKLESGEKGMPAMLIALAATFLYLALDARINSSGRVAWNYNSPVIAKVYNGHLNELKRIESKKPRSYHSILRKFFSNCISNVSGISTHVAKKTRVDYENLPDSFSD